MTPHSNQNKMTTNRYSMMDAFTPEEFATLYDLVMFHDADECPEWMDATVRDKVFEKVSDVMTEFNNSNKTKWHSLKHFSLQIMF